MLKQVKVDPLCLGSTDGKVTMDISGFIDTTLNTKSFSMLSSFNILLWVKILERYVLVFPWPISNVHLRTNVELVQLTSKLLFAHKVMDGYDGSRFSANTAERYSL